jgi:hypothetical protein
MRYQPWFVALALLPAGVANADPVPAAGDGGACRAGSPEAVAWWARPADDGQRVGYYVGGGCPFCRCADGPHPGEGTWGFDYRGWLLPRRVILGWWHGLYQGGSGAYKTDGPKLHPPEEETGGRCRDH